MNWMEDAQSIQIFNTQIPLKVSIHPNWSTVPYTFPLEANSFVAVVDLLEGIVQSSGISISELAWLEEFQPPDNFVVRRGVYKGPVIGT